MECQRLRCQYTIHIVALFQPGTARRWNVKKLKHDTFNRSWNFKYGIVINSINIFFPRTQLASDTIIQLIYTVLKGIGYKLINSPSQIMNKICKFSTIFIGLLISIPFQLDYLAIDVSPLKASVVVIFSGSLTGPNTPQLLGPGTHFTNDLSITIQIRWTLHLALITGDHIATKIGTWHDSPAVVPCAEYCSDYCISIWMRAKWNFHLICDGKSVSEMGPRLHGVTHVEYSSKPLQK